ncbi:MAG: hypothetical protein GX434_15100 [Peptococcaceae bacterium]|nr:hypothetical protein [Peptococcaceae bacterium]
MEAPKGLKMNLDDFQDYIESRIVERWRAYYQDGCVLSLEENEPCCYQAEVEGSDVYLVNVELDQAHNIVDSECDCPYDLGEYCKHEVAVFFALREKNTEKTLPPGKEQAQLPGSGSLYPNPPRRTGMGKAHALCPGKPVVRRLLL